MASRTRIVLDHLIWSTPDLDRGRARWLELTGTASVPGGSHSGRGTRNALVPLLNGCYVEILAPDPEQTPTGTRGAELAASSREQLSTFCCRGPELHDIAARARAIGLSTDGPQPWTRLRPDGVRLSWTLLYLTGHPFEGLLPFFIDWQDSPHPAAREGEPFSVSSLTASHPDSNLQDLYMQLALPAHATVGPPALRAELQGPRGTVLLTS